LLDRGSLHQPDLGVGSELAVDPFEPTIAKTRLGARLIAPTQEKAERKLEE
jgi:hypothetical protein